MAIEILDGIARKKNVNHQVHHDLESFVWVMCYSVTRRLVLTSKKTDSMDGDGRAALHKFFYTNFGRMDIRSIAMARRSLDALLLPQTFHELVPQPMSSLYDALYDHVQQSILRKNPTPLSHKILLAEFDKTIEMMMSVNIETCVGGATDYVGLNSRRIIPSVGHLPGTPK
jgi:hypothetical protein